MKFCKQYVSRRQTNIRNYAIDRTHKRENVLQIREGDTRTDCQAIGFQLYRIAILSGISRDGIGDGFG